MLENAFLVFPFLRDTNIMMAISLINIRFLFFPHFIAFKSCKVSRNYATFSEKRRFLHMVACLEVDTVLE